MANWITNFPRYQPQQPPQPVGQPMVAGAPSRWGVYSPTTVSAVQSDIQTGSPTVPIYPSPTGMATHQGFIDQNSQLYPGGSDIYIRNQQRRAWGYSTPQSGVRAVEQDAQRVGYDPHPMTIDQDPTIDPVEMARQQQARDRQNYLDFNPNAAQEEAAHQQSTTSWGANKGMDSVHNYAGDIRALISWLSGIFGRR